MTSIRTIGLKTRLASRAPDLDALPGFQSPPPWRLDITPWVKPGGNRIEVFACNTLANHYTTIPTYYRGATTSGLIGPVRLRIFNDSTQGKWTG